MIELEGTLLGVVESCGSFSIYIQIKNETVRIPVSLEDAKRAGQHLSQQVKLGIVFFQEKNG